MLNVFLKSVRMNWSISLKNAPPRVNHSAVVIDHKIYSFGGYTSLQLLPKIIDVHVFYPGNFLYTVSYCWKPVPYKKYQFAPPGLYGHSTVAFGRKIYLWGGQTGDPAVYSDLVYCFDVDKLEWSIPKTTGQPPNIADGHSACVIDDFMYIFGGYAQELARLGQDVFRFHLRHHFWERIVTDGAAAERRDFHTASVIGDRMYIFGGRCSKDGDMLDDEYYCHQIMYLDTSTMTWVAPAYTGKVPCGRRSHSACVYKNEIYIIGGFDGIEEEHLNDVHKFNPETNTWHLCEVQGKKPIPRRRHCTCVVGDSLYLFGGSSPGPMPKEFSKSEFQLFSMEKRLIEQSDMHVLDFTVSLKRLAQIVILKNMWSLDMSILPKTLSKELEEIQKNKL